MSIRAKVKVDQNLELTAKFKDLAGNTVEPTAGAKPEWEIDPHYFDHKVADDGMTCIVSPKGSLGFSAVVAKYNGLSTSFIVEIASGNAADMEVQANVVETSRDEEALAANVAAQSTAGAATAPVNSVDTEAASQLFDAAGGETVSTEIPAAAAVQELEPAAVISTNETSESAQLVAGAVIAEIPTSDVNTATGTAVVEELPTSQGLSDASVEGSGETSGQVTWTGGDAAPVSTQEAEAGVVTGTPELQAGPAGSELQGDATEGGLSAETDEVAANLVGADTQASGGPGGEEEQSNEGASAEVVLGTDSDTVAADEPPVGQDTIDGSSGKDVNSGV